MIIGMMYSLVVLGFCGYSFFYGVHLYKKEKQTMPLVGLTLLNGSAVVFVVIEVFMM